MRERGIGSLLGPFKQDRVNSVGCSSYSKHQGIMGTLKDTKKCHTKKRHKGKQPSASPFHKETNQSIYD